MTINSGVCRSCRAPATVWLEIQGWHAGTVAPWTACELGATVIHRQCSSITPSTRNASPVASRTPATACGDAIAHITFPGPTATLGLLANPMPGVSPRFQFASILRRPMHS